MTTCPHCAAEMPDGTKFCRKCGGAVELPSCPSCGAPAEGEAFCGQCGASLTGRSPAPSAPMSPVAERRVTSVLFGDLVGFTPLSESKDSEEVRELLSTYFAHCRVVIGRYGGVVEKFIGDAVMAVWGVPVAHEDDAERAVRAGLDLVATVAAMGQDVGAPGLAMRVGVVTGEVAVTLGATAEGMVAGDAVNTAARVQSAAEPGRVWVDEATRSLASVAITFEDTGEHSLKGKAEPMRLWQAGAVVAEVGGGQRVDGLEAPLAGRDPDLRLVKELFHATQELRKPKLVVVDGEAGIGKSRLAWEFQKYVDGLSATIRWHWGRCLSYGNGTAFWALAEAVRARFGLVESDAGEVVTERLDAGLQEHVPDEGERDWLRPRLAVLLGSGTGGSFAREDLFAAWTAFLEHLAESSNASAVVLVIDDAQHADDGLLDFLDHLLATARAPIFVLALARPELLTRRSALGGRRTTVVPLEPLDDDSMATLIDGLVHGLPAPSRKALVARAEGVPLFAVETVRVLIDRDLVVPRDGRYVPAGGAELDLEAIGAPASLQALVAARLDALTPEERRVVADASVLGLSFTLDGLLSLGSDPQTLDALLASLVRKEIVALQTDRFTAERGHYRFVQTVVRQIAYGTQSKRDRKARHLAAADYVAALPDPGEDLAVVVAQHLLDAVAAAPHGDPDVPDLVARACMDLERAATRARTVGAPAEAQNLLETALTHVSDPADQARLHLAAALAASDVGHDAESSSHAETAAALFDAAGDAIRAGQAAAQHARAMVNMGDNAAAIAISEARWRALEHVPGTEPALLALGLPLSVAHGRISQWDQQRFYAEKRLLLGEALDEPEAVASGHVGLAIRYAFLGAPLSALMSYRNAAGIARDHDLPAPLAMALNNVGATLNSRDLTSALVNAEEAIEVARRAGLKTMTEWAISTRMSGLWAAGRYREVAALLAEVGDSVSDLVFRVFLNTLEAWLAAAQGNPIPPAPAELPDSDEESALAIRDCAEITRALAAGDPTTAARLAERSFDHLLAAQGLEDDFSLLWPHFVLAALAADDLDLADRLLEPVTRALPGRRSPAVAAHWHRFRGLVAAARGDDPDFAETELRAGIDGLDAYGALGYRAQAQDELARWLVGQHRQEEAEPLIDAARATYAEIGATGWLANLDAWHASTKAVAR